MRITEHDIWVFLLGSAIGASLAYFYLTREKRLVDRVRREIDNLGLFHDLPPAQYQKTMYPTTLVDDAAILAIHQWAQQIQKYKKVKLDPSRLTAEVVICEQLLGLSRVEAVRALLAAESLDDLRKLRPKISN